MDEMEGGLWDVREILIGGNENEEGREKACFGEKRQAYRENNKDPTR